MTNTILNRRFYSDPIYKVVEQARRLEGRQQEYVLEFVFCQFEHLQLWPFNATQ